MADKRKLGSGEKKFRDRSQNHPSSNRVQNKVKRKRPLTEEEKRLLMRKRGRQELFLPLLFCLPYSWCSRSLPWHFVFWKKGERHKRESLKP